LNNAQFSHPSAEYRIQPFWFWNGEMDDAEIVRQIREMYDKGVGGFFICPRQGLKIPYLSEAWFRKVKIAVEAAKQKGMHVWLYDEYPYPSGIAGGEVTLLHPDAKHQTLEDTVLRVSGGSTVKQELPWAKVLFAKAVPVTIDGERLWDSALDIREAIGNLQADPVFQKTGLTAYNQKRFFTYRTVFQLDWQAPSGYPEWDIILYQEKEVEDFKYYGTFVDPCHREAMATFIRLTHEKYKKHLGEEFGKTVKGMFTDEIGLLGRMPWSPRLPAYFEQRNGYSILDSLPALSDAAYPDAARVRYDYYQALHELLTDSYHKQVYDWCEEHGLQYVAEVPSVRMTTQRFSHVPGGDSAHEKLGRSLEWVLRRYAASFRDNPKMMSSIARQLGRERNLDECFHSVGWSMNLQDAKWMIDRMAAFGTNMYTFHAFFYTLDGLTQHDAPPSQFYQNPYWEHFRQLGDYAGRISCIMAQGTADIRIAMVDPTTSYWTHMANPLHHFDYGGSDPAEKAKLEEMKEEWRGLSVHLLQSRRDYDHMDAELLAEASVEGGKLRIGKAVYSVLLLPPMTNLERKAWEKLTLFLENGGTVISFGSLPVERIEPGSRVPEEAAAVFGRPGAAGAAGIVHGKGGAYSIPRPDGEPQALALARLDSLLDQVLPRAVSLDVGEDCRGFLLQSRYATEDEYLVFASNQESAAWEACLTVDAGLVWAERPEQPDFTVRVELLDLEMGTVTPLQAEKIGQWIVLPVDFAPYASRLIRFTRMQAAQEQPVKPLAPAWSWPLQHEGPWKLSAMQDNVLRLDRFQLTIGGLDGGSSHSVEAKTFIDQCADLAENLDLPVSFDQIFGTPKKLRLSYPLDTQYKAIFRVEQLPGDCRIMMDESALSGEWVLRLNGKAFHRSDFTKQPVYDNANLVLSAAGCLMTGLNELTVEMTVSHDWDGVTDAIHILGDFGVIFTPDGLPVLTATPEEAATLSMGPYYPGYPYYAGKLSFQRTVLLDEAPEPDRFRITFPDWDVHDAVEVLVNGQSLGVRPWSPFHWEGASALLCQGPNKLEVRVTGTLIGLLEGKYFDYTEHRVIPV
jgi:hypothetical protein